MQRSFRKFIKKQGDLAFLSLNNSFIGYRLDINGTKKNMNLNFLNMNLIWFPNLNKIRRNNKKRNSKSYKKRRERKKNRRKNEKFLYFIFFYY